MKQVDLIKKLEKATVWRDVVPGLLLTRKERDTILKLLRVPAQCARKDELVRLVEAVKRLVDRHAEIKEGSGVLSIPALPHEMKNLRASLEPFREITHQAEIDSLPTVSEIVDRASAVTSTDGSGK